jgi:hypothetical protein
MLQHPYMLAWLAGATVPLILHLLSRSRYRPVPWGAMMFLTGAQAGTHHMASVRQWILLLLRMMTIGLLAVALARPVVSPRFGQIPTGGLTTGGPAAIVIILDDSASMGYETNGKTRLDQAREVTLQILGALKRGDQAALLITGTREYQPALPPNSDLQSIAERVADLQPDTASADFATDLPRAADLLDHASPADHEIYIITDRQAYSWRAVNDAFKQRWANRRSASSPPRVTVIPVGGDESDNTCIEGFEIPEHVWFKDQLTDLQVRVRNFGPQPVENIPLSVWTGSHSLGESTLNIPARTTRVVNFPIRFPESGSKVISAAVKTTGFTADDRMDFSVDVLEPPTVLLVSDRPAATQPVSILQSLLAGGHHSIPPTSLIPLASNDLNAGALKKANVVVLDDVARLSAQQTKALQAFASPGGGILFLPGDDVASQLKGNPLYQAGSELLPIMLLAPIAPAKPRLGFIDNFDRQNSVFRTVALLPTPFAAIPFARYFPIGARSGSVKTLARFGTNDPWVIENAIGRGHVLLLTSPLDPNWNALSHANLTAPLLQAMLRYLDQGAEVDRNLWPGQAIVVATDEPIEDRSATVQFASIPQRDSAMVNQLNGYTEIRYAKTTRPGTYRLRYRTGGKERVLNYVVRAGHGDSDLTTLTDAQWASLADRIGFQRIDSSTTNIVQAITQQRGGREIWIDLIGAVVVLMMLEMILSRQS